MYNDQEQMIDDQILSKFLDNAVAKAKKRIEEEGRIETEDAIPLMLKSQFNHIAHLETQMATKTEIAELKEQFNARFGGLSTEFNGRFGGLSAEFNARFGGLSTEFNARFGGLSAEFNARFGSLTTEFNARFSSLETQFLGLKEQFLGLKDQFLDFKEQFAHMKWLITFGFGFLSVLIALLACLQVYTTFIK